MARKGESNRYKWKVEIMEEKRSEQKIKDTGMQKGICQREKKIYRYSERIVK